MLTLTFLTFLHKKSALFPYNFLLHVGPEKTTWHVDFLTCHLEITVIRIVFRESRPYSTKKGRFKPSPAYLYHKDNTFFVRKQIVLKSESHVVSDEWG